MVSSHREPVVEVGLLTTRGDVTIELAGTFMDANGTRLSGGVHIASAKQDAVSFDGLMCSRSIVLSPVDFDSARLTVRGVKIGIGFHWEREESQEFQGELKLLACDDSLTVINVVPIESYLVSVISSEMSASCPPELLRAHAVASRSWLLAQLASPKRTAPTTVIQRISAAETGPEELIKWYGRESHDHFDICADDHCQRYQGISKAFSQSAFDATRDTRGKVLTYGDEVCDTRYSKSCGGMTEIFSSVWDDEDIPYLKPVYDGPGGEAPGHRLPLSIEANAEDWITSSPLAYCAMVTPELLARILPGFDQETGDYYRWSVDYSQEELNAILRLRLGRDFGRIRALVPLERGESSRIIRLKIVGERRTLIIGKELEIRRALSRSHLYSSAFVVRATEDQSSEYPARFTIIGAGWGHGVGLCQIGAAVMADRGHTHEEILAHYFQNTVIRTQY